MEKENLNDSIKEVLKKHFGLDKWLGLVLAGVLAIITLGITGVLSTATDFFKHKKIKGAPVAGGVSAFCV